MDNRVSILEGKVSSLEVRVAVAESEVKSVREDVSSIKDDTKWLRRAITNALIGGTITLGITIMGAVIIFIMKGGMAG